MTEIRRRNIFLGLLGAAVAKSLVMLPGETFAEAPREFDRYEELVKRSRSMIDDVQPLHDQRRLLEYGTAQYRDIIKREEAITNVKLEDILQFIHDNFATPPEPGTEDFQLANIEVSTLLRRQSSDISQINLLNVEQLRGMNETAVPVGMMLEFMAVRKIRFDSGKMTQVAVFQDRYGPIILAG